ncbi:unnamed protein product [Moneuplotes crassus]|uniref:Uncharacterized protein n=1 Tax=Euplotes crassus TaxID=5936 RepID=A0AAD1UFH1_EUPCR|nr:unnamed protein product [Moneuplotes crassus]
MNFNQAKNRGRIKVLTTNKPPKAPGLPQIHSRNSLSNEENIINFRTFDVSNNRTRGIQRPQINNSPSKYTKSRYFKNSMQMLRAIGNGQVNIALSYDLRSLDNESSENNGTHPILQATRLSSSSKKVQEMSYVQFFNDLRKENKKKRRSSLKKYKDQIPKKDELKENLIHKEQKTEMLDGIIKKYAKSPSKPVHTNKKKRGKMELYNNTRLGKKRINLGLYGKIIKMTEKNKKHPMEPKISDALEVTHPNKTNLNISSAKPEVLDQTLLAEEKFKERINGTISEVKNMMHEKIKSNFQNSKKNMSNTKSLKLITEVKKETPDLNQSVRSKRSRKSTKPIRKDLQEDLNIKVQALKENPKEKQQNQSPMIKIERLKTKEKISKLGDEMTQGLMEVKRKSIARTNSSLPKKYKKQM